MRPLALALALLPALVLACAGSADGPEGSPPGDTGPACQAGVDADGDGLDACEEAALGTDPDLADSDGDGLSDGAERDCVSDPLDGGEVCYACGWAHGDPGNLASSGSAVGEVVANVPLVDQCGEDLPLWDLAGGWRVLFITTEWCGSCLAEARELAEAQAAFVAETGLDLSYAVVLFQDSQGRLPDRDTGARYAERAGIAGLPVLADPAAGILAATPYAGDRLPGVCTLSPQMEILSCEVGDGAYLRALDAVRAAAGQR